MLPASRSAAVPRLRRAACAGLLTAVFATLAAGCATPGETSAPTTAAPGLAERAQRLARSGDAAGSAQAWEQAAAVGTPAARAGALANAARQWLAARQPAEAERVYARLEREAPVEAGSPAARERSLLAAEIALGAGQPARALAALRAVGEPAPPALEPAASLLRARALVASGRVVDGLRTFETRERGLASADVATNRRVLWESLRTAAALGVDMRTPPGADPVTAGWLELARLSVAGSRNPAALRPQVEAWRARYAAHPANGPVVDRMLATADEGPGAPARIALLLPLSGRIEAAGGALRDGFMAAWLQQDAARRPELRVYDSDPDAVQAYRRAVADGAGFVIGPLAKEDVQAVARVADGAVTTLALNTLPDGERVPPRFYQYALAPEDEARQVAERLVAQGLRVGVALVPSGEWGTRVLAAFDAALREGGGAVVSSRAFPAGTADYSDVITSALGFGESERRHRQLVSMLGASLEFTPRRREDLQFVFVAGQPVQGRLIRPQLKFHYAGDLPVYSISDLFDPDPAANVDLDGLVFPDMPWTLAQDAGTAALRDALTAAWPQGVRRRGRLYAMGFDAHRLVAELDAAQRLAGGGTLAVVSRTSEPLPGLTGRLTIDATGRVRRSLDWATIGADGEPRPLPAVVFAP